MRVNTSLLLETRESSPATELLPSPNHSNAKEQGAGDESIEYIGWPGGVSHHVSPIIQWYGEKPITVGESPVRVPPVTLDLQIIRNTRRWGVVHRVAGMKWLNPRMKWHQRKVRKDREKED